MTFSMRDLDQALQGCGQKSGVEIWRIENFKPVAVPKESHGRFFTGDSYIVLKTTSSRNGSLHHDIHYWLGKDSSQDEAGAVAVMTVELDSALGGRAVQYREVQGQETEKFLSYFKPCIIPQEGGVASGFNHVKPEEHQTRLYICKGKHVVRVPFARSTLNHEDVFILDTESKIFQFSGSNSSIQERAKALEVVQYIKDTYHDGKCDIAAVEDGRMMADAEAGEFWGLFGGFAPLPKKPALNDDNKTAESDGIKLFSVDKGKTEAVEAESLEKELLDTNNCYILDCGLEMFVWKGRNTSIDQRKNASEAAEEFFRSSERPKSSLVSVMEGFETVMFRSKFDSWPASSTVAEPQQGRGKVAALLKRQGVNVQGLVKTSSSSSKDEPKSYIDGTGDLQVWRINGEEKILLEAAEQSKFYSGDCYIFQYSYPGEDREEHLVGTWLGKQSVEEDRATAISMASKMVESMKFMAAQARIYEGEEPIQFFVIMQSFITFKGGLSDAFKKHIAENEIPDTTYDADGVALFRVQGSAPENMQAIQIDAVSTGLNSSHCYILHGDSTVFTWCGNLTSSEDKELMERMLDLIKPNEPTKAHKEGSESDQFWELLGGKLEYPNQKMKKDGESDPHLFSCTLSNEIFNFTQDDLMTEDIFVLDCHTEIFVWVGQQVDPKKKPQVLAIGEKFLKHDFLLENLASETPIYIVTEGNEPPFFTRFFTWDASKSAMHGNSYQRKLAILTNKGKPLLDKPKRRVVAVYSSRSSVPDKAQPRSRSMTFSPDRARVRGRSPAFNALAANFENINTRNQSTPPPMVSPMVRKLYPKSLAPDLTKLAPKSSAIAARTALFERSRPTPQEPPTSPGLSEATNEAEAPKPTSETAEEESMSSIHEDSKEDEAEEESSLPTFPYERLKTDSEDPAEDIDLTRREAYMTSAEFKEKFEMTKNEFYKLPKNNNYITQPKERLYVSVLSMATERPSFELAKGINGLDKIVIRESRSRSAEVYLYGGHVTSWKNENGEELLYLSSKFSNLGALESHGFARNRIWEVDATPPPLPTNSSSNAFVDLILRPSEDDLKIWPHNFEFRMRVALGSEGELTLTSRIRNTNSDGKPFTFTFAYHTYFAVSDISTPTKIAILDHEKKRTFVVRKDGLADAVVWNPWEKKSKAISDLGDEDYKQMLCVEAAAIERPITLKPGEEWKGRLELSAVPSSYSSGQLDPKKVLHAMKKRVKEGVKR
ncbi:unnamed protein product [Thlaspi arvense]|uniref:glucose-6-phosphate 1-epimerase n=1 Tax=Thlaspi arvense TaxID=13288 RepID=A0AAU9SMK9_THLAR|nr:unnamed protein product [Thlaspi arvense]